MVTLAGRSCVARQEPYIPGALSILPGTVPGRVRGSGHMVPTYFRRELRDRVLQRRSRLRTSLRRFGSSSESLEYWIIRARAQLRFRRVMTVQRDAGGCLADSTIEGGIARDRAGEARCVERS